MFLLPLIVFLVRDYLNGYRQIYIPKVLYWWLGLAALGVFTILVGPLRQVAALEVIRMLKLALLFVVVINEVVRVKQFKHVVAALMVAVAIQCLVGLLQFTFDLNLGAQVLGEAARETTEATSRATYFADGAFGRGESVHRISGLIGHPNLLAVFLAILLPIGISILFSNISPIYKAGVSVVIVIGLISLVLTLSRSGWISFGVGLTALMFMSFVLPNVRGRFVFERMLAVLVFVVIIVALSGPIIKRISHSDEGAVNFRWQWMGIATEMALDKPVFGHGLNSFVWFMPPYTPEKTYIGLIRKYGSQEVLPVVHNIYLLVWAEQGTLGLIVYLAFYFHLMRIAWRGLSAYQQSFLAMVNLGCLIGLLALAVDGLASFFIRNDNCGRVFFLVAALVVAIQYWHKNNPPPSTTQNRPV